MYWCSCVQAWLAKGFSKSQIPKNFYTQNGMWKYQQVETRNGDCIHCSHCAVWSKTNPEPRHESA